MKHRGGRKMRKHYFEPELTIREYSYFQGKVLTTSSPETGSSSSGNDLYTDDKFDPFGDD
jgi:hypothetical protein